MSVSCVRKHGRTIVIHGLLEPLKPLLEHLPVDIYDIHGCLPVRVLLPRKVKYAKRDVARPARNVDAAERAPRAGLEARDKVVLPEAVDAHGHGVVHEVVRGRDAVEDVAHERLLCVLRHRLEPEMCCPL